MHHADEDVTDHRCVCVCQEQLEHAEVSTALRYLGQYYFKNKLYDEAALCAQRCCDYNDVSSSSAAHSQLRDANLSPFGKVFILNPKQVM